MENKPTNLEELFQKFKDYADVRMDLFKLKSINKISIFMSSIITMQILVILLVGVLLCITVGASLLIGEWVGKIYCGFFIVAGIYIIIGLVLYVNRGKWIKTPISNKLIKEMID
ncbi:MAG: hypothetical protein ABI472_09105 [Ginsengibacter sp.]